MRGGGTLTNMEREVGQMGALAHEKTMSDGDMSRVIINDGPLTVQIEDTKLTQRAIGNGLPQHMALITLEAVIALAEIELMELTG